jgi:hypothetical protein
MSKYCKFIADSKEFVVSHVTLNNCPECLLTKVVNDEVVDPYIIPIDNGANYIVDRDPDSFAVIISFLRGYPISLNYKSQLREKILCDMEYFKLTDFKNYTTPPQQSEIAIDIPEESYDMKLDQIKKMEEGFHSGLTSEMVNSLSTDKNIINVIRQLNNQLDNDLVNNQLDNDLDDLGDLYDDDVLNATNIEN